MGWQKTSCTPPQHQAAPVPRAGRGDSMDRGSPAGKQGGAPTWGLQSGLLASSPRWGSPPWSLTTTGPACPRSRGSGPSSAPASVPAARRQRGQGQPAAASPGCQHSAATAILRHSRASTAPIFKRSRAQLWLDNAGFALISQSRGAHRGGTSAPRQGFVLRAVPLLCHGHLLTLATSWVQGTGSSQAPSSSTRTSQPWGDTGTVRGRAGTRGIRGSGETSGSQGQRRDAAKEGGHLETPRASPRTRKGMTPWEGTKRKPERHRWSPGHREETGTQGPQGTWRERGVLRGGPGGERGPEETGHAGGAQHPGEHRTRGVPGSHPPPRAGGSLPGLGATSAVGAHPGALTDLGFFLGARLS